MADGSLLEPVADFMRETAEIEIMPRYQALQEDEVREKTGPKDLVTIADLESERRLTLKLRDLLPGSEVIGEEAASNHPEIFQHFEGDSPIWIIDPVDGTSNFAKGSRHFCVMVGLVQKGETRLGVILDPLGERWISAERGAGAWSRSYHENTGERLNARAPASNAEMEGALNLRFLDSPQKEEVRARAKQTIGRYYSLGCAGHEYIHLVEDKSHFSLYVKNMPWDHAPGCLIHAEAGGYQARFDGRSYHPGELTGGLLCAPDEESWRTLYAALFGAEVVNLAG